MISHKINNLGYEAVKIMVTGAGGLIGSCLTNYLRSSKYDTLAIYHQNVSKGCGEPYFKMDLSNEDDYKILEDLHIDMIIHCAATIPESFHGESAKRVYEINKIIDNNTINFCERKGIRLVYMSGCSIYGLDHQEIKHENSIVCPVGFYIEGKYESEERILHSNIPKPVIIRVSSPYGRTQHHQTVLKLFLEKALKNQDIFYHGSGTREQDFINVLDIAAAVKEIIKNPHIDGVFNIASGQAITMKELAELIVQTTESSSRIRQSNQLDTQEGYKVNIDVTKIKTALKWNPRITLEQGIITWADALRKNL